MKTTTHVHRRWLALAAGSAVLVLASANIASGAKTNTGAIDNANETSSNGISAAINITIGLDNSAFGFHALEKTTTGSRNTAIGSLTLQNNIAGQNNTAVGFGALTVATASGNTALGSQSLQKNTSGPNNTATGVSALLNNTTGGFNTATGRDALNANIDGTNNTAFGFQALLKNTSGDFNVAIGDGALHNNILGIGNIGIGDDGGFNLTGDNNICIGNTGLAGESNIIRIGTAQTDTFLTGIIRGDGSGLTGIIGLANNAVTSPKIAAGAVNNSKLAANLTLAGTTSGTFSGNLTGNATTATNAGSAVNFTGALAGDVTGTQGATVIANGVVTSGKLAADLTLGGTTVGTFSGNGALLTNLNASNLASGTVDDARLSTNVALRAGGNAFTGNQSVVGTVAATSFIADIGTAGGVSYGFQSDTNTGIFTPGVNSNVVAIATTGGERMRVDPSGNVGIGTDAPAARLHVESSSASAGNNTADFAALNIGANHSHIHFGTNGDWFIRSAANAGKVILQDSGGNVGIGTASPTEKLHVVGNGLFTGALTLSGSGSVRLNGGDFKPLGTSSDGVQWVDAAGLIQAHIHRFGSSDNRLYITNSGPQNLTGVFLASGGTSIQSTSDERLKFDIEPVTGILDKIKDIRVVGFNMATLAVDPATGKMKIDRNPAPRTTKDGTVIKHQIGTIAQDWIANFPELLIEPETDEQYYGLAYDRIGVVALGAVKELSKIVSQKDAEIARLTAELAAVKAREQANEARLTRLENALDNAPVRARAVNAVLDLK